MLYKGMVNPMEALTMTKGQLLKKPSKSYRVSEHAMERFRERVDEHTAHRAFDDLADLLNARIKASRRSMDVTDHRCPDEVTTLYELGGQTEAVYVAVVRNATVVTILDEWMAGNNFPEWRPALHSPFAQQLAKLKIEPPPPPPPDPYLELALEVRDLARQVSELRAREQEIAKQHRALNDQIREVSAKLDEKQQELLAFVTPKMP